MSRNDIRIPRTRIAMSNIGKISWKNFINQHLQAPPTLLKGFWPNIDLTTFTLPLNDDRGKFFFVDIDVTSEDIVLESLLWA